jgi:hypothetical protein
MNNFKRFFYVQNLEGTLWGTVIILVVLFGRFRFITLRGRVENPEFTSGLSLLVLISLRFIPGFQLYP